MDIMVRIIMRYLLTEVQRLWNKKVLQSIQYYLHRTLLKLAGVKGSVEPWRYDREGDTIHFSFRDFQ